MPATAAIFLQKIHKNAGRGKTQDKHTTDNRDQNTRLARNVVPESRDEILQKAGHSTKPHLRGAFITLVSLRPGRSESWS